MRQLFASLCVLYQKLPKFDVDSQKLDFLEYHIFQVLQNKDFRRQSPRFHLLALRVTTDFSIQEQ